MQFEEPHKNRILFLGNFVEGPTGIVSCLARSLESLGHTVFRLDTVGNPPFLKNPTGVSGGMGPIYPDLDALCTILDVFRPEVILTCAGGLVWEDDDVERLKDRGILTMGLTLSDPDTQPTIVDHVGRFDIHTTNATLALERYFERGITNTTFMPFGVDHQFATRSVAPHPEYLADAICIGHATARPERHELMGLLADRFKVRVYGQGWELPGARPVGGDELLTASASGTFHINFPLTRKGFQNVKCGVFESVALGGIVCTEQFDELGSLFRYGEEVIGYTGGEHLATQLEELLSNPARLEQMRRRAYHRLASEHLYEHRMLALFQHARERVESDPSLAHAHRFASAVHDRPRHVLLSGWGPATADVSARESLAQQVEGAAPDTVVRVGSTEPAADQFALGRPTFDAGDPYDTERAVASAGAVILSTGLLLADTNPRSLGSGLAYAVDGQPGPTTNALQVSLLARGHGVPLHLITDGAGRPSTAPGQRAMGLISGLATSHSQHAEAPGSLDDLLRAIRDLGTYPPGEVSMITAPPTDPVPAWSRSGWREVEALDLSVLQAHGRGVDPAQPVAVHTHHTVEGEFVMNFRASAPRRGDVVATCLPDSAWEGTARKIELRLENRYAERPELAGRLAWEVGIGDGTLIRQDITTWREPVHAWLTLPAEVATSQVELRVRALRDCEAWGWGPASALRVIAVRVMPITRTCSEVLAAVSSPTAEVEGT